MNHTFPQKNIVHGSITAGGNVIIGDTTYINNYFAAQEVKIPHRLTNNIPTNADHILGRDAELATTKTYLAQNQAAVLFNGIGGIGKTSVASKYMALNGSEYKHLAWITVQSTLAEAFTNNAPLLASLHITQQVQNYIEAKQLDKAFEYLFHQLNLLERTLVVIDNANDLDDLDQYKNWFDTANCHFLITSRSQPSEWATVEVDSLPEDEAIALFRKLHPSVSADDVAIKNLLSKLFYHTLLIELVAKAGASTGIPFADLQTMIETQFIHHQSLNEAPIPTGKHGSVVATNLKKAKIEDYIWLIFSQVKGLDDDSKQLLKAMSLLPVATPFDLDFLKEHFAFFNIPNVVVHLDALIERGWLQKEQAEGQKLYFKMHPLIADVVVQNLKVSATFAKSYIKHISDFIYYDYTNFEHFLLEKNRKKSYAERLTELFSDEISEEISELYLSLGFLNQNFGYYEIAAKQGEIALKIAMDLPNINPAIISKNQSTLALAYGYLGNYDRAVDLLEKASEINSKIFDEHHVEIAINQNNLGSIYQLMGNYKLSATFLEKALVTNLKNFNEDHPKIVTILSNLGVVYTDLGNYEHAASLLEKVLSIALKNFNEDNPSIAIYQNNLSIVYRRLGDYNRAAQLGEMALVIYLKNYDKEHPEVANCQSNLGNVYSDLGNHARAVELGEIALATDLKNSLFNHPSIAIKQSNLGVTYSKLGNFKRASELLETSLASDLKRFGEAHPTVAISQNNLAMVYHKDGRYKEAKALWEAAYQNYLNNFGATHPHTVLFKERMEW